MRRPGPYDVSFAKADEDSAHSTSWPHFVTWNGFPLHFEPCNGYAEAVYCIRAFEAGMTLTELVDQAKRAGLDPDTTRIQIHDKRQGKVSDIVPDQLVLWNSDRSRVVVSVE